MGSSFANARLRRTSVLFFSLGGGWLVPFSSGAGVRAFQRQRKRHQPRRAAPDGASCEKHPRIRPYLVVAPSGAVRRRSGAAFALYNGSTSRSPRRGACARRVPTCGLNCRLPLGAARRGGVGVEVCFAFPNDVPAAFPLAALVRASPFPNERDWDSPPRPAELVVPLLPLIVL